MSRFRKICLFAEWLVGTHNRPEVKTAPVCRCWGVCVCVRRCVYGWMALFDLTTGPLGQQDKDRQCLLTPRRGIERDREREREGQRGTDRDRYRERDIERGIERERQRERDRERGTEREREIEG